MTASDVASVNEYPDICEVLRIMGSSATANTSDAEVGTYNNFSSVSYKMHNRQRKSVRPEIIVLYHNINEPQLPRLRTAFKA